MKLNIIIIAVLFFSITQIFAQSDDINVLNYYAVSNSLDGQILVDKANILRFFPVFAIRSKVESVKISLFYGSNIFSTEAVPHSENQYWDALLPSFKLGEAIQRIEVEVKFKLNPKIQSQLESIDSLKNERLKYIQDDKSHLISLRTEAIKSLSGTSFDTSRIFQALNDIKIDDDVGAKYILKTTSLSSEEKGISILQGEFLKDSLAYKANWESIYNSFSSDDSTDILDSIKAITDKYISGLKDDHFKGKYKNFITQNESIRSVVNLARALHTKFDNLQHRLNTYAEQTDDKLRYVKCYLKRINSIDDSLSKLSRLPGEIRAQTTLCADSIESRTKSDLISDLADTLYSGVSVRKSDIIFDEGYKYAHILYRNYKNSLRKMPALDASERMGIFRVRYVPFPIIGTDDEPRPNLKKPFHTGSPTVFELGLAFGNAIVPGDDFVPPSFAIERLGVAFAVDEHLFTDSAKVLALALTYDFNSYGSIGIGCNFAGKYAHQYYSFGINKKAFEAVVKEIAKLFK